ncbi:hypothetical protein FQN54_007874 [Arachnomyces sp. PD_36]|nr:hypothetical protein FQN54_007874 [Arachnomyces sp. PD_36]
MKSLLFLTLTLTSPLFSFSNPTSPDCEPLLPITITGFTWHNSTHNCGCDDPTTGCPPTGFPVGPGCGPPDTAQATFDNPNTGSKTTCYRTDPGSVPADIIPSESEHSCLSLGTRWTFGVEGWIMFTDPNVECPNGRWTVTARGNFDMGCVEDPFGNTTCAKIKPSFDIFIVDSVYAGEL